MTFKKGQSGNPAGRTKQAEAFKEACRTKAIRCLERIERIAEDSGHDDHLKANLWICEQGYGKAAQSVELGGKDGGPVTALLEIRYTDGTSEDKSTP